MTKTFFRIRYMTILAVIASLGGAALLLLIGTFAVVHSFALYFGFVAPHVAGNQATEAVVSVIESLDNFLLAFVLIYFAYSVYFLFIHDKPTEQDREEVALAGNAWFKTC